MGCPRHKYLLEIMAYKTILNGNYLEWLRMCCIQLHTMDGVEHHLFYCKDNSVFWNNMHTIDIKGSFYREPLEIGVTNLHNLARTLK